MKTFLVIDRTHDDYCIMQTEDPTLAIGTCQVIAPYECKLLEVWKTEEDPDTATDFETVYRWDVETGKQLPTEDLSMKMILNSAELMKRELSKETDKLLDALQADSYYPIPNLKVDFNGNSFDIPMDYAELNNLTEDFLNDLIDTINEYM